jgi:hypothetical protein
MPFIVTASSRLGAVAMASDTAKSAIERADELIKQGLQNVSITAPDGRRHRPDEFREWLLSTFRVVGSGPGRGAAGGLA